MVTGKDGSIWIGTNDGLRMWNHGEETIYGKADNHESESRTVWSPVRYMASRGLRDHVSVSFLRTMLAEFGSDTIRFRLHKEWRLCVDERHSGGVVTSVAQDGQGDLWVANEDHGLVRLSKDGTVQQISWASIGDKRRCAVFSGSIARLAGCGLDLMRVESRISATVKSKRPTDARKGWAVAGSARYASRPMIPYGRQRKMA